MFHVEIFEFQIAPSNVTQWLSTITEHGVFQIQIQMATNSADLYTIVNREKLLWKAKPPSLYRDSYSITGSQLISQHTP